MTEQELDDLKRDAARWRALATLTNIRLLGWSGADCKLGRVTIDAEGFRQIGAQFSTDGPSSSPTATVLLTAFADHIIEQNKHG